MALALPIVFPTESQTMDALLQIKGNITRLQDKYANLVAPQPFSVGKTFAKTGDLLSLETSSYLKYTITPPTMFIGYQVCL